MITKQQSIDLEKLGLGRYTWISLEERNKILWVDWGDENKKIRSRGGGEMGLRLRLEIQGEAARIKRHLRGWYGNLVQCKLPKIHEGYPNEVSK